VDLYSGIPYTVSEPIWDWDIKGYLFYINSSYELAIKCFDKAIELDPSYVYPYISKGQALERLGRHDDALKEFDKAATLNPLIWVIWESKGDILFNQGKYDEALAAYNMTIELVPKDADAWFQKGNAFGLLGKYNESIKSYEAVIEVIRSNPDPRYDCANRSVCVEAWHRKGIGLKELGRTKEAGAAFAKAKELGYSG
jgi:tetratricopeptide (TPR) repeat protein